MDGLRRGSMRLGLKRSLQNAAPDYSCAVFAQQFHVDGEENDQLGQLQKVTEGSVETSSKRPRKGSTRMGEGVRARAEKAGVEADSGKAHGTAVSARVSKFSRAARTTRSVAKVGGAGVQTEVLKEPSESVTAASSLPTPSPDFATHGEESNTLRRNMDWSRESSVLSDAPSDLPGENPFDANIIIATNSGPFSSASGPQNDQVSMETATSGVPSVGDEDTIAVSSVRRPTAMISTEASPSFRSQAQTGATATNADPGTDESTPSVQELPLAAETGEDVPARIMEDLLASQVVNAEAEAEAETVGRPKRQRSAPKRYGISGVETSSVAMTDAVPSDLGSEEEDADFQGSPKKRRRTSTSNLTPPRAPRKVAQFPSETASGAKRGRGRPKKVVEQPKETKIVKLDVPPSFLSKLPETPPPSKAKATQKTSPKQTRAPRTPKTAVAPALPPTPESVASESFARGEIVVDSEKLALSRLLTAREPLGSKPSPQGQPLVWAESRQALCETLPYFKRPQGGCYQNDSHVYGFLFDGIGHCREYLDEDVIICRAGGSMEQDPSGGMVQKKNQSMKEAQVQAIINDIAHQNPLIVICGNRNGGAKCEMPHQYSVLGWYKPVAVWEEKTAGKGEKIWTTIKYRLERLNSAGEPIPWHAPAGSDLAALRSSARPVDRQQCQDCGKEFDQVYLQGWMCINSACDQFWQLGDGRPAPAGGLGLDYNPDFLLSRAPAWGNESISPAPVRPPPPDVGNIIGDNLAYINTRGICCPKCGRCNSRRLFDRWLCENSACDFELRPQHRPVTPLHLHVPWDNASTLVRNKVEAGVHLKVEHKFGYKVCTYTFDGIEGCFIHAAATKEVTGGPGGPDEMMASLQSEDLGLERRVFATTKMSGGRKTEDQKAVAATPGAPPSPPDDPSLDEVEPAKEKRTFEDGDLMTAFSMNYGMPYKFVASGASRSFEDSPQAVNNCRHRLNWAARTLLNKSKDQLDFNEELIFAYLEGQKIEYHDDGEDGLGPEIASLSLGGRAKMHMRLKAKHYVGCSKTGILTEERPVPGSIEGEKMYVKRLAAWEELQELKNTDSVAYNLRRKEVAKELGIFEKRTKKADDLVTVTLSHGDIMVMDGYDIQRYLEHKVVPKGCLRFALTCRTVLGEHLKPEERPGYVVQPDEGVYDGSVGF